MFAGSVGIGFDIYQNAADPAANHPGDINDNHVSVHYDNDVACVEDATPLLDLAGGGWIHARIVVEIDATPTVTVQLTAPGGSPATLIAACPIAGLVPYEGRVFLGARSGGESADHDLDNVEVAFNGLFNAAPVADAGPEQSVNPSDPVTLNGTGSFDPEDGPLTYAWTQTVGPSVSLSNGTSDQPSFTAPAGTAELGFQLVVNDGEKDSVPDLVGVTVAERAIIGSWSEVFDAEIVPVHNHLLPTGKVLYWEGGGYPGDDPTQILGEIRTWDPATGQVAEPPHPPYDIFCAGHSFLADGRLMVTGGHDMADGVGLPDAALFDPVTSSWTQVADMGPAGQGRWYPTNTTLDNGDVLVLSGTMDASFTENRLPQIWRRADDSWLDLTDAEDAVSALPDADHPLGSTFVIYPRMFLAPDGRVFKADANPSRETWFLNLDLGAWEEGPMTNFAGETGTGLGGSRDYGSAVYYEAGKILIAGGGDPPTASAEVIDLNEQEDPLSWVPVAAMEYPRRHQNAVLLPNGSVLVVGGTASAGFNDAADAVLEAEIWDPADKTWSTVASMTNARVYHSTALLLPDGRVLAGGGGRPPPDNGVEQRNFELYSPPYLFSGPRPVITSAPSAVNYGQTFFVETPDAGSVTDVTLIRLASVTHAFDQNQRFNKLSFEASAGGLQVSAPTSATLAPPGHYMLFAVDVSGAPSVGSMLQLAPCPQVLHIYNQIFTGMHELVAGERIILEEVEVQATARLSLLAGSVIELRGSVAVETGGQLLAAISPAPECQ